MILYPLSPAPQVTKECHPIWEAILRTQKQTADEWLLIAQADHAVLAGEMACHVSNPALPALDPEIIQAISVHDDGWKDVDTPHTPQLGEHGRPLSFFEEAPADTLRAWRGSIASATQIAPIAGILVSEHFCRIARNFSHAPTTPPELAQVLTTFVERENAHQEDLREKQPRNHQEIHTLVDVLQFFDLLSLYACSGSQESAELPQTFHGNRFRLSQDAGTLRLQPSLFAQPARFAVKARKYSASGLTQSTEIPVVLI